MGVDLVVLFGLNQKYKQEVLVECLNATREVLLRNWKAIRPSLVATEDMKWRVVENTLLSEHALVELKFTPEIILTLYPDCAELRTWMRWKWFLSDPSFRSNVCRFCASIAEQFDACSIVFLPDSSCAAAENARGMIDEGRCLADAVEYIKMSGISPNHPELTLNEISQCDRFPDQTTCIIARETGSAHPRQ